MQFAAETVWVRYVSSCVYGLCLFIRPYLLRGYRYRLVPEGNYEQLVEKLKAQDYPATLISSSQRYRVSIESFPTENEANAARDEYRKITDRQDIWVHKVN